MFQCAWCKKESNVWEWSKQQEPLCSECSGKYHFGLKQGMITGKVSDLSKEQRRAISEKLHNLMQFRGAMRAVEKEALVGWAKIISRVTGIILGIIIMGTLSFFMPANDKVFSLDDINIGMTIILFLAIPLSILLAWMLHDRFKWLLKFYQLKRNADYNIDFYYDEEIDHNSRS